jgi:hypothetical protein
MYSNKTKGKQICYPWHILKIQNLIRLFAFYHAVPGNCISLLYQKSEEKKSYRSLTIFNNNHSKQISVHHYL